MDFQNVSNSIRTLVIERGRTTSGRALVDTARVPPRGVLELSAEDIQALMAGEKPGADSAARARLALFLQDFRRGAPMQPVTTRVRFGADKAHVRGGSLADAIARAMAPQEPTLQSDDAPQNAPEDAFHARDASSLIVPPDPDAPRAPRVEIASVIPGIGPDAGRMDLDDLRAAGRRASVSAETEAALASTAASAPQDAPAAAPQPSDVIVGGQPAGPASRGPKGARGS